MDDLDELMADLKRPVQPEPTGFGTLAAPRPTAEALARPVFRIAIMGDFSGRAARGLMEVGATLADRRAIKLDVDTVEDVIEGFASTLVLPVGADGKGIVVDLEGLDSLHPDELVEKVELFDALKGLRQRLSVASMADRAVEEMKAWGAAHIAPPLPTSSRSAASAVPANLRLSDFQKMIGDRRGTLATPSPAADLIARIVGPHVVPGPNAEAKALRASVDEAMSGAMRLVLHHPEFQAIESQWRTVDLLARRIEVDETLEVVLYDISAEEFAADLSASDDLSASGLFQLLNAPLQEEGGCGFSAVFGLYTFEETPPHATLMGRMGRIASHVQAPFVAAITPAFLEVPRKDRNPIVARAWDGLRKDPVAHWLGLASPRFLLRRPYGARTEPVDAFDFEEFTMSEGLSGMLWGNPAVLVAILLAGAWRKDGPQMAMGKALTVGDLPYHFVKDRHGDQVALPCTERVVTIDKAAAAMERGYMPLLPVKGRDVVRLGAFRALSGREVLGRWASDGDLAKSAAAVEAAAARPMTPAMLVEARIPTGEAPPAEAEAPAFGQPEAASAVDELDALLAGFGEEAPPTDPAGIDAELAALLEGL